jgi:hypothetical protein
MICAPLREPIVQPFSTYDQEALIDYFTRVARPKWARVFGRLEGAIEDVNDLDILPININFVSKIYRAATEGWRYDVAAWRWLRPARPILKLENLRGLQSLVGMDHHHSATFAACLAEHCNDVAREYPGLALWVGRRVALLEFIAKPPPDADEDLKVAPMALRKLILQAHYSRADETGDPIALADEVLSRAMDGAAHAVRSALGAEDVDVSANLMFHSPRKPVAPPGDTRVVANAECANAMWGSHPTDTPCLVIVAETRNSRHLGFWVPLLFGDGGVTLPGAPTAFTNRDGAAVFKDDLPSVAPFGAALEGRWRSYMVNEFRHMLFVSVPYRIPRGGKSRESIAVLNVNVTPGADVSPWRRAYHREWLRVARDRAEPFLDVAADALMLIYGKKPTALIDTVSPLWDSLPLETPRRLLGGEHD